MKWILALIALGVATPVAASELLMFEKEGCPWCLAWKRDVGGHYGASAHAALLPLRHVDIAAPPSGLPPMEKVRYSPTFVAIACGEEVDRITGYAGRDQFWDALDLAAAKVRARLAQGCP